MKIELHLVPEDEEGRKIKDFLIKNNLIFHKTITDDLELLCQITQRELLKKVSMLKIQFSHSIHIIEGY